MKDLVLTQSQQNAYDQYCKFILNPSKKFFVLQGYAGTGKSTLVNKLISELPKMLKTLELLVQKPVDKQIVLTATTGKACEALAKLTGRPVITIHSFLGLRVVTDYKRGTTSLEVTPRTQEIEDTIVFIDEASFADKKLKYYIEKYLNSSCKVIYIGDPAQLQGVKSYSSPVFEAGYETVLLTEEVRQAQNNPLLDMIRIFRDVVNGEPWRQIKTDPDHVIHIPRHEFNKNIIQEFKRPDWKHDDSKVLAYTNKTVINYNQEINRVIQGNYELEIGDYAICNSYISNKNCKLKTDQTVLITGKKDGTEYNIKGWWVSLDSKHVAFLPKNHSEYLDIIKKARADEDYAKLSYIERTWIDLRAAYACTINKSQGSTFDTVFIDLDDVKLCKHPNTLARLMYVATSRARFQVIMTGDLV